MKKYENVNEIKLSWKLNDAVENGIISLERALEEEMEKRNKIITNHIENVYPIKQLPNGRYYCKLNPQDYKHPMTVNRARKEDVEEAIYQHYREKTDNVTFEKLFWTWQNDPKTKERIKDTTLLRYEQHFKQFFTNSMLIKVSILKITSTDIETFFIMCIRQGITAKTFANIKSLINKIYSYAYSKGLKLPNGHSKDIIKGIQIPQNEFKPSVKKPCEASYSPEEVCIVRQYILDNYTSSENKLEPLALLGVLLTFFTGVRCGELAALKVSDFDEINSTLLIERMETRNQKANTYSIKPPKTKASNRNIFLSSDAKETLEIIFSIRKNYGIISEYLFTDRNGERLNCSRFATAIDSLNTHIGLRYNRSMHDIRRTYASILYLQGVPPQFIQRQLGHETIQQTFEYIQYLITEEEGKKYLEKTSLSKFQEVQEEVLDINSEIIKDNINEQNNVIDFKSALLKKKINLAH